ncbi:hypothetical protein [Engelhardtia mirabilis]|uniref:Alginate export domain-containing protein n=1 Tax=Engelhardtia mirabilis TaxID=2528011 RepID=A0A518BHE0_9BACT|nr:hypothetical protein Pla133_14710 [Planctomycetes bacterium Pla133]QDV00726.1 hypothetical protein Pla86_14700 [Planctomycetes bacterium Pla86]
MRSIKLLPLAALPLLGCAAPAQLNASAPAGVALPDPVAEPQPFTSSAPFAAAPLAATDDGLFSARWADNPWNGRLTDPVTQPYWFESPLHHTSVRPVIIRHWFPSDSVFKGGTLDVLALQARLAITQRFSVIATKDGYFNLEPDEPALEGDGYADIAGGAKYAFIDDPSAGYLLTGGLVFELSQGTREVFQGNGDGVLRPFVSGAWDREELDLLYTLGLNYPLDDDAESTSFDFHLNATYAATENLRPMIEFNGIHYISDGSAAPFDFEGVDVVNLGSNDVAGNTIVTGAIGGRWLIGDNASIGLAYELALSGRQDIFDDRVMLDLILKL